MIAVWTTNGNYSNDDIEQIFGIDTKGLRVIVNGIYWKTIRTIRKLYQM